MDVLKIAASVSTPIGLLGLVVALGYLTYALWIKHQQTKLQTLPPDQRAVAVDEYLTRYGIDGTHLPQADKLALIREEMEKRHRRSIVYVIAATVAFVMCFAITAIFPRSPETCEDFQDAVRDAQGTISQPRPRETVTVPFRASGTAKIVQKCVPLWLAVEVNDSIWPRREGHVSVDPNDQWSQLVFEQGHPKQFGLSLWAANHIADIQLRGFLSNGRVTFSFSELQQLGMKRLDLVPELHLSEK